MKHSTSYYIVIGYGSLPQVRYASRCDATEKEMKLLKDEIRTSQVMFQYINYGVMPHNQFLSLMTI